MTDNTTQTGVEILCIGTELLLGNILNSNAKWLAEELACLGLPHYRQTVIGDNAIRLKQVVIEAAKRSQILITTGGLGPTPDDLTTATIAEAFNTPLEERKDLWLDIKSKLAVNNQIPSNNNRKQARLPLGAEILPNQLGTAPGMIWSPIEGFTIITFPGVPNELKQMWSKAAVPWLRKYSNLKEIFYSKVLKFTGITESKLAEKAIDLLQSSNPTVAPYASLGEVKLRITVKATNIERAKQLLQPIETELIKRIGINNFYGSDNDSLASVVLDLLNMKKETLTVAESCTAGGVGAAIAAIPGASKIFVGGVIAYSNSIKQKILGVPIELLEKHGAVSNSVVQAMAQGARARFGADWAIAISGLAGPGGGTKIKPVGLVHIAIAGPEVCESFQKTFGIHKGRVEIQQLSVISALDKLRLLLLAES